MRKLLFFLFCLFSITCYLFTASSAYAADPNFDISVASDYKVKEDGVTEIAQTISITNKTEFYFTPTYTVSVGFSDIQNIQAYNSDGTIPTTLDDKNPENKKIKLTFQKRYAGLNETHTFTLKFTTKDIAVKQGSIWEVTIPGIESADDFNKYTAKVSVPENFGKARIIKPDVSLENGSVFLEKNEIGKSGVYILYGDKQYYSFKLKYNISNPNLFPVRTEIALPSKTNYQNVHITSFSTVPLNVTKDFDGNWVAEYRLLPQQKKTVEVTGIAEVFPYPTKEVLSAKQREEYTKPKKNWDSTSEAILKASGKLKTPKEIYEFVVKTLSYNHSKIATDNLRLGGQGALSDPLNSVCLEFTDLFISLARSKGIPSRAVEGYAFTQNSEVRPLSLVNDILHAWPEYYDDKEKRWVMVDPTWGNTTKGMDYFSSLDFSHVAFAVKGLDSEYPIPAGGYKFNKESKDVEVSFARETDFKTTGKIEISESFPNFSFPKVNLQGTITIRNGGNAPQEKQSIFVTTNKGSKKEFVVDYLPPGGSKSITTTFTDVPFLTNGEYLITIQVGEQTHKKAVRISFIPDLKLILIVGGLLSGSIIIAAITFHTGSLLVQRRKRKNTVRR